MGTDMRLFLRYSPRVPPLPWRKTPEGREDECHLLGFEGESQENMRSVSSLKLKTGKVRLGPRMTWVKFPC